jgi:Holliday junction DNA helicase RuvA
MMISILTGTIRSISTDRAVVEVGGFGLSVIITPSTSSQITLGTQQQFFTSLVVREDSLTLFGFLSEEVKTLFELVQTVSGIGPKVAMSIVGAMSPEDLARAISQEEISVIEKVPGIGRKGAQRLILELKGKLNDLSQGQTYKGHQPAWREKLSSGLTSLGFSPKEADGAITDVVAQLLTDGVEASTVDLSELLKLALASGKNSRG